MKMNRLPAQKNKPNSNPIYESPKSLAKKSGKFAIQKILGIFQKYPIYI